MITVVIAVLTAVGVLFTALGLGMSTWDAIGVEFAVYGLVVMAGEVIRYRRFKRWTRGG